MKVVLPIKYKIAIHSAIEASEIVMKYFRTQELGMTIKSDNSPVTLADLKSSEHIIASLKETKIPVLSEEGDEIEYQERKLWDELWIVDPLDGTKEFIAGKENFAINIGLVKNGEPIFGVIVIPVSGEVYFGGKEMGSFYTTKNDLDLSDLSILPTKKTPKDVLVVTGGKSTGEEFFDKSGLISKEYDSIEFLKVASSVKFCLLAEGIADVYPRDYPCMEWDTASGQAILNGVGKDVYRKDSGVPLRYNKEDLYVPFFISC